MATYTPSDGLGAGTELAFHLLIDPPSRQTQQTMSERIIPNSTSVVDRIGKSITKIRGAARFDSYGSLTTFEGVVGTRGTLVYSEEPGGIDVIFVSMDRTRVTAADIHLANVEFWLMPADDTITTVDGTYPRVRSVSVSASTPSATWANILSARVSYGFDMRTGECQILTPTRPEGSDYDQELTVVMGAGNNITRFVGVIRDFQYQANPAAVTTVARGFLTRAIEYENSEETNYDPWTGSGGLLIPDLLGTLAGSASDIVQAVLDKANVPYSAANIKGSAEVYGGGLTPLPFMWRSGGSGINSVPQNQDQGETAMSYVERYDAIDAELDEANPNAGGRYRTFETLAGDVYRVRVGGRPQDTPDFTLTEGLDILGGSFTRSISQTRNYFVVKGQDRGSNLGPYQYGLLSSNPFQPSSSKHTYQFSSDMLEKDVHDAVDGITGAPLTGMSCEVLAGAFELEYNREIVSGSLETFRDDAFGVAQTHLVQGGPGGTIGALGLAENVWVQSMEISVDDRGFTQRLTYLGGGLAGMTTDLQQMLEAVQAVA
jgi:hypothetical protein